VAQPKRRQGVDESVNNDDREGNKNGDGGAGS
jgi:hypothetical protein